MIPRFARTVDRAVRSPRFARTYGLCGTYMLKNHNPSPGRGTASSINKKKYPNVFRIDLIQRNRKQMMRHTILKEQENRKSSDGEVTQD